jgi:hypothetical protein
VTIASIALLGDLNSWNRPFVHQVEDFAVAHRGNGVSRDPSRRYGQGSQAGCHVKADCDSGVPTVTLPETARRESRFKRESLQGDPGGEKLNWLFRRNRLTAQTIVAVARADGTVRA